jgi:hypothetical protein
VEVAAYAVFILVAFKVPPHVGGRRSGNVPGKATRNGARGRFRCGWSNSILLTTDNREPTTDSNMAKSAPLGHLADDSLPTADNAMALSNCLSIKLP